MSGSLINRPVMKEGSGFRVQECPLPTAHCPLSTVHCLQPTAYTLVEILVAMTITLILLGAVVQMFAKVGESISESRSLLEASERLRSAAARLQMDLQGVTVTMLPPRNPEAGEGYFEYIEGPITQDIILLWAQSLPGPTVVPRPINSELTGNNTDTSVGDFDDILMFTTQSTGKPFVGIFNYGTKAAPDVQAVQSDVAEVAWFMRGRTLYRRQLLVAPGLPVPSAIGAATGFYANNDISVRVENNQLLANTLSDLTRRECRYAHSTATFPFDARVWGALGLPTLRECSYINNTQSTAWIVGRLAAPLPPDPTTDFWTNDPNLRYADDWLTRGTKNPGDNFTERLADDVILTNVIGFDVKAWDPGANGGVGGYVDLGYEYRSTNELKHYPPDPPNNPQDMASNSRELFFHRGHTASMLFGDFSNDSSNVYDNDRVYDTWSTHYEIVGLAGLIYPGQYPTGGFPGRGTNGFDDNNDGIVDDINEQITSPPYPVPLRGAQVKIRIFEPDSRQIRELTVVQDFPPK